MRRSYAKAVGGYPVYSLSRRVRRQGRCRREWAAERQRQLRRRRRSATCSSSGPGDGEKPENATQARMLLKDSGMQRHRRADDHAGHPGGAVRVEQRRRRAAWCSTRTARSSCDRASGRRVVVAGDLETERIRYLPAGGSVKQTLAEGADDGSRVPRHRLAVPAAGDPQRWHRDARAWSRRSRSRSTSSSPPAQRERPMLPTFGCGIHDLVFAPNDAATIAEIRGRGPGRARAPTSRASTCSTVDASAAPRQPNLLLIRVDYRIRSNNALRQPRLPLLHHRGGVTVPLDDYVPRPRRPQLRRRSSPRCAPASRATPPSGPTSTTATRASRCCRSSLPGRVARLPDEQGAGPGST